MKAVIKIGKARAILFFLFVIPYIICIAFVIVPFLRDEIGNDALTGLIVRVTAIYLIPVGIFTGSIIQQKKLRRRSVPNNAYWMTLVLSIIWNILIVWRVIYYSLSYAPDNTIEALDSYLTTVSPAVFALVGGVLTYMFLQSAEKPPA
jgi:hypothetical protein